MGGFTLLEVLIASAILVAAILPIVEFSQRGLVEASAVQEELLASEVLIDLCERFKSSSPEELEWWAANLPLLETDRFLLPLKPAPSGDPQAARTAIQFQRGIRLDENVEGLQNLHLVTFTVSWKSRAGKAREVSLTRLLHWN